MIDATPARRGGTPEEVADAVVYFLNASISSPARCWRWMAASACAERPNLYWSVGHRERRASKRMKRRASKRTAAYVGLLAAAFAAAMLANGAFGRPLDNAAYDYWFLAHQPRPQHTQSAILEIDEASLVSWAVCGISRKPLADGLRLAGGRSSRGCRGGRNIATRPKVTLRKIRALEAAFRECPTWRSVSLFEGDPVRWDIRTGVRTMGLKAIGHAYAQPDESDSSDALDPARDAGRAGSPLCPAPRPSG